jgi:creatinine amidohydrolase
VAVIDGHYENEFFLSEACDLALREMRQEGVNDFRIVKMRYCEDITEETLRIVFPDGYPGLALEHAALLETSMMLYCFPELVDLGKVANDDPAKFPPYDVFPSNPDWVPPPGSLSRIQGSTADHGKLLVEEFTDLVVSVLEKEFRGKTPEDPRLVV